MAHLFCIVNIMAADDLAMQGAKALAAMVLIWLFWIIPASALNELM